MGHTKPWAIAIVILCTAFTAVGSLLLKKGANNFGGFTVQGFIDAHLVIVGLFFYFLGFILLILAFRHGELSTLYPFVSLSFVWVAILSSIFLGEMLHILTMFGVAAIVAGVVLIGISSHNTQRKKLKLKA